MTADDPAQELVVEPEPTPAEAPFTLAETTTVYQTALTKFGELETKASTRQDATSAKDFHAFAELLRSRFKPAEVSAPDAEGMASVLTDNPIGAYNFVVFNPHLMLYNIFGMWTAGDAGVPVVLIDGTLDNEWLTVAVIAHELAHAKRALPYMQKHGDPDNESRRERFGRAAAREALDTVSDGQYSKLIASTAASVATPTDKNGFTAVYVDPALFDLFSVHHERARAWFYQQALFDLNVDLDRKSAKGKTLEERLDRLNDRFLSAQEDPEKALQISWGADE